MKPGRCRQQPWKSAPSWLDLHRQKVRKRVHTLDISAKNKRLKVVSNVENCTFVVKISAAHLRLQLPPPALLNVMLCYTENMYFQRVAICETSPVHVAVWILYDTVCLNIITMWRHNIVPWPTGKHASDIVERPGLPSDLLAKMKTVHRWSRDRWSVRNTLLLQNWSGCWQYRCSQRYLCYQSIRRWKKLEKIVVQFKSLACFSWRRGCGQWHKAEFER